MSRTSPLYNLLLGWESRDSDASEPCSVERGSSEKGNLEILVSGLTYSQAEKIEEFIEQLRFLVIEGWDLCDDCLKYAGSVGELCANCREAAEEGIALKNLREHLNQIEEMTSSFASLKECTCSYPCLCAINYSASQAQEAVTRLVETHGLPLPNKPTNKEQSNA
jgi:hypothetical protein